MSVDIIEFNDAPLEKIIDKIDKAKVLEISRKARKVGLPDFKCQFFDIIIEEEKYVIICDYDENVKFDCDQLLELHSIKSSVLKKIFIGKSDDHNMRVEVHIRKSLAPNMEEEEVIQINITRYVTKE
jgi:hypothetical protein